MDEFDLIERFFASGAKCPGVTVGIGDDGAVLRPASGQDLVTVIDTLVADVHFLPGTAPDDIGYRAVAVNLSDIAAMGAVPRWMTLALTLPDASEDWLDAFSHGLKAAAAEHGVALVGGDTTRGETLVITVQISGEVPAGSALLRSGAQAGDDIYVTGTLGDAAGGLQLIKKGREKAQLTQRFLRPSARVETGLEIRSLASACIDISDGLAADLGKLLRASAVGGAIEVDRLPVSAALEASFDKSAQYSLALNGGDDYELCFTASPSVREPVAAVGATRIGFVVDGPGLVCRNGGEIVNVEATGYRHFQ